MIELLTPIDIPMLSYLGWANEAGGGAGQGADTLSVPCIQQKHQWQNDVLVPFVGTPTDGSQTMNTNGATIVVLTAGHGDYFEIDDVVLVTTDTPHDGSVMIVDAATNADAVSVTRVSPATNGDTGNVITITKLGTAKPAGSDVGTKYRSTDVSQVYNYCQIFMDQVKVAASLQSTEAYGLTDHFAYQLEKKFREVVIQLEKAAIYGRRADYNSDRYFMGGLAHYLRDDANANRLDGSAAVLTESMLIDLLEDIWEDGGEPNTIMVNSTQKRYMNAFISPFTRTEMSNHVMGILVGQYEADIGTLDIVLNRHVQASDLIVFDRSKIGLGPLKGYGNDRSFFYEQVPKAGDWYKGMIIGEYTMEVKNNTVSHGWYYNLATT